MVVKQNRGRKRYILFTHSASTTKNQVNRFLNDRCKELNGKIRLKLMKYDSKRGIVRVDHKLAKQAREIMNRNGTEMKIQTVRTSGTLKGLEKE